MYQSVKLAHLRPYPGCTLDLVPGMNVLFGPNGCGKTTVLEAIHVLATTRSYRATRLFDLVSHQKFQAVIEAETSFADTLRIEIEKRKHRFFKNNTRVKKTSEFLHTSKVVVLAPEHQEILSGGGTLRRAFLDQTLAQQNPMMLDTLKSYRKILRQKQALLSLLLPYSTYRKQVDIWNHQLIETGEKIREARKNLCQQLVPYIRSEYAYISSSEDEGSIEYLSKEENMVTRLEELSFQEHKIKRCLVGPHRDDFVVQLRNTPAKITASQGERASLLLALTFAQMRVLSMGHIQNQPLSGPLPTLLLDDVGVTLDPQRRAKLFQRLQTDLPQTLITTPDESIVESLKNLGATIFTQQGDPSLPKVWRPCM